MDAGREHPDHTLELEQEEPPLLEQRGKRGRHRGMVVTESTGAKVAVRRVFQ